MTTERERIERQYSLDMGVGMILFLTSMLILGLLNAN